MEMGESILRCYSIIPEAEAFDLDSDTAGQADILD
jgi:hypothetical protein